MSQFHWSGIRDNGWVFTALALVAAFLLATGWLLNLLLSVRRNDGIRTEFRRSVPQPSGDLTAALLRFNGGATVDFYYGLALGRSGEDAATFPLILGAENVEDESDISFTWTAKNKIHVRISGKTRSIKQLRSIEVHGQRIFIDYSRIYPNGQEKKN
jgi:hypothetical protein